jgi:hypothetical protein
MSAREGSPIAPSSVCRGLLAALDASEGRRKRRQRDTTPDALGLAMKRELLELIVRDDPDPDAFEGWLLAHVLAAERAGTGGMRAMALEVFHEWRLAATSPEFTAWLAAGAPSDDRSAPPR